MKICGIITEYNPFHNGHAFHLNAAKAIGTDGIVCVMSGNFTQRGGAAIADKWVRTKMALSQGVDLVIELPTIFALSTAEKFAFGGVHLLNSLGCVTDICFGGENDDIAQMHKIATILMDEPAELSKSIKSRMNSGDNFPTAREKALNELYKIGSILSTPNNILAIEYLKAIIKTHSTITPHCIARKAVGHHDISPSNGIASATAIRAMIAKSIDFEDFMPIACAKLLHDAVLDGTAPIFDEYFENIILAHLRLADREILSNISEVIEGLENRIIECAKKSATLEELISSIKTKRYTRTKIQRIIWKSFLSIANKWDNETPQYIRVLGMNDKGKKILSIAKKQSSLPIVTKTSTLADNSMFAFDVKASNLYPLGNRKNCAAKPANEFRASPIIF